MVFIIYEHNYFILFHESTNLTGDVVAILEITQDTLHVVVNPAL